MIVYRARRACQRARGLGLWTAAQRAATRRHPSGRSAPWAAGACGGASRPRLRSARPPWHERSLVAEAVYREPRGSRALAGAAPTGPHPPPRHRSGGPSDWDDCRLLSAALWQVLGGRRQAVRHAPTPGSTGHSRWRGRTPPLLLRAPGQVPALGGASARPVPSPPRRLPGMRRATIARGRVAPRAPGCDGSADDPSVARAAAARTRETVVWKGIPLGPRKR